MISLQKQMTLASTVLSHIHKANQKEGPVSRAQLNFELRKVVDNETLSTLLLNLLGYGYLHKKLEDTTVLFWVSFDPEVVTDLTPDPIRPRDTGPDLIAAARGAGVEPNLVAPNEEDTPEQVDLTCPLEAVLSSTRRVSTATRANAIYQYLRRKPDWPLAGVRAHLETKFRPLLLDRAFAYLQDANLVKFVEKHGTVFCETATRSSIVDPYVPPQAETAPPTGAATIDLDLRAFARLSPEAKKVVNDLIQLLGNNCDTVLYNAPKSS